MSYHQNWEGYNMPHINVNEVIVRKRMRKVNKAKAESLAISISDGRMINPIILNGNTLVAGAHRLEAHKILEEKTIWYVPGGELGNDDSLKLIEIDENLFRNELSEAERSQHISERVGIIARRKMPENLIKKEQIYRKINKQENSPLLSDKVYQKVTEKAEKQSTADAKKELGEVLGTNATNINSAIKNHKAVTDLGLDQNELEELDGVSYKRVAKVAKDEEVGKVAQGSAKKELHQQLTKTKNESVIGHDEIAKLKQDTGVLVSARSIIKKRKPDDCSGLESAFFDDGIEILTLLIEKFRG